MHNPNTQSKITPFSFVNAILTGSELDLTEDNLAIYNSFLVNKGLSFYVDCIFIVNEINLRPSVEKKQHYNYYKYSVRKYKRPYMKWINKEQSNKVDLIKRFFNFSTEKALEVVDLISEENLNEIKEKLSTGGLT